MRKEVNTKERYSHETIHLRNPIYSSNPQKPRSQCVLAQATITKYRTLDSLNVRHSFLTFLEIEKSKVKVLASLIPGKSPLPGHLFIVSSHDRD